MGGETGKTVRMAHFGIIRWVFVYSSRGEPNSRVRLGLKINQRPRKEIVRKWGRPDGVGWVIWEVKRTKWC